MRKRKIIFLTQPIDTAENKALIFSQRNRSFYQPPESHLYKSVDSDVKASDVSLMKTTDGNNTGINFMVSKYTPDRT